MTWNNFKCNHLIPLHFKGLTAYDLINLQQYF